MKRPHFTKLSLESLERREMMAADATLANGLLHITGTDNGDYITVSQSAANQSSDIITVRIRDGATMRLQVERTFKGVYVDSILAEGFRGNDLIFNNTNKPSELNGGFGRDTLQGSDSAPDVIYATNEFGGEDTDGNFIYGRGGEDTLMGASRLDEIDGGRGEDYIYGAGGSDLLMGGGEVDYIFGEAGSDIISGGGGADWLYGDDDFDTIHGDAGNDHVFGGAYFDILFGDADHDSLFGDDESVSGDDGGNEIHGGTGNDNLYGAAGWDDLFGDDGTDNLYGFGGDDELHGGNNNDDLDGGDGGDSLFGEAGDDDLFGGAGGDMLDGGANNDKLFGQDGRDTLHGRGGDDELHGGADDDVLLGGAGDDLVAGGAGGDYLYGDVEDLITGEETEDGDDEYLFDGGDMVEGLWGWVRWSLGTTELKTVGPYTGYLVYRD
jgi:Ca2+-binding RTX toxin-like protein